MANVNSTLRTRARKTKKPKKPYPEFPLFAHASGRWCKKIRGAFHYFGPWADWHAALQKWEAEKVDLLAGRKPAARRRQDGECTMRELGNHFLTNKRNRVESGELSQHSFRDYHRVCESLIEAFGKERFLSDVRPLDFERLRASWAKKWGPVRLGNEINRVRVVFNFAYQNELIDKPVKFGGDFRRPPKKVLRLAKEAKGKRLFEAGELRAIIYAAKQPMKAMILLGINCGLGNSDVARMKLETLDLASGWINYPRPKTGVARKCPLWPETVAALRDLLDRRPAPVDPENAELVFLTPSLASYYRDTSDNPISRAMRDLLDSLKVTGNKNFYALRHTLETVGGGSLDQVAVDAIMGHVDNSMAGGYREEVTDDRLTAVAEHIRIWLFAKWEKAVQEKPRPKSASEEEEAAAST